MDLQRAALRAVSPVGGLGPLIGAMCKGIAKSGWGIALDWHEFTVSKFKHQLRTHGQ
jgi:hypothetical protein